MCIYSYVKQTSAMGSLLVQVMRVDGTVLGGWGGGIRHERRTADKADSSVSSEAFHEDFSLL